jgi:xanthine dehydrogenase accessory factor
MSDVIAAGPHEADWPLFGMIDDVRPALAAVLESGRAGALATLVGVDGPSPRPLGAQMLITTDGRAAGYVSGGCVEGSIATLGMDVIESGRARLVVFGEGSPFEDVRLICGARIEVVIERVTPADESWRAVLSAARDRIAVQRCMWINGRTDVCEAGQDHRVAFHADDGAYVRLYAPRPRVFVLGFDPVAIATCRALSAAGFETILARRMGPQAAPPGIADTYRAEPPGAAIAEFGLDAWTALITTTHDLDDDHDALVAALPSPAFYVGALGSRRRLVDRLEKLTRAGVSEQDRARLRAPVGLDIGAQSPAEIAVSIAADVIQALRKGQA